MTNASRPNNIEEVFSDVLERLAAGESVEDAITPYPEYAEELNQLLAFGLAVQQLDYNDQAATDSYHRIRSRLQAAQKVKPIRTRRTPNGVLSLVASLLIIGFVIFLILNFRNPNPTPDELATQIPVTATITATISTPTETVTLEPIQTELPRETPSQSVTNALPELTVRTPTFTPVDTSEPVGAPPQITPSAEPEQESPELVQTAESSEDAEHETPEPEETEHSEESESEE